MTHVIAVDVDEVCAAMLPEWVRRYNIVHRDTLDVATITDWDLTKFVKPECGVQIYDLLNSPTLYQDVEAMPGALAGVQALRRQGYRVLFVTSATKGHAGQKLHWLQQHGFLEPGKQTDPDYIECSDKALIRAHLLIDDRPSNLETFPGAGLLFPCAHNAAYAGRLQRVQGWAEIPTLVDRILRPGKFVPPLPQATVTSSGISTSRPQPAPAPGTKATNPKDIIGGSKIPMHLWPETATVLGAMGFLDGMLKYGRTNYRVMGVRASIYYDACKRHLDFWFEGEETDPDSGLPHLAHALACIAIIVDAEAAGKLTDDRLVEGGLRALVTRMTPHVARLKALHADKAPKHYTIADNGPDMGSSR